MRIVIALGGNALLQRGQPMTAENQRANIRLAAERIAAVVPGNEVVIAHGNGPQVGLLALQAAAYHDVAPYPLDVLGAQTEAMIGYVIEQELGNLLPFETAARHPADHGRGGPDDPAFDHPTKPIGPVYDREAAERGPRETAGRSRRTATLPAGGGEPGAASGSSSCGRSGSCSSRARSWSAPAAAASRRCTTNDGQAARHRGGDRQGPRLGAARRELEADLLVIATDVDGVYADWGTPEQRRLGRVTPDELSGLAAGGVDGSQGAGGVPLRPQTGHDAVIGSLADIDDLVAGTAGTRVRELVGTVIVRWGQVEPRVEFPGPRASPSRGAKSWAGSSTQGTHGTWPFSPNLSKMLVNPAGRSGRL